MENHLLYKMLEFGLARDKFRESEIREYCGEDYDHDFFVSIMNPRHASDSNTMFFKYGVEYRLTPQAAAHYMEMSELREARKASKQATRLALASIVIALLALVVNLLFTQQVEVVKLPASSNNLQPHQEQPYQGNQNSQDELSQKNFPPVVQDTIN